MPSGELPVEGIVEIEDTMIRSAILVLVIYGALPGVLGAAIGDECDVVGDCVGLANIECKDPGWGVKQCLCVDNYAGDGNGNCARDCGARTAPENGVVTILSGNGFTEGSVIRFDCNPGFNPSSSFTPTCTTSGTWSNSDDVICSKVIGTPCTNNEICHSLTDSTCRYQKNDTRSCDCKPGSIIKGQVCFPRVLNDTCPSGNSDCTHIPHAECRRDPDNIFRCLCAPTHMLKALTGFGGKFCSARDTEVRLANGHQNFGRLELKYNNIWGTVCYNDFTDKEAKVACRSVGLNGGLVKVSQGKAAGNGQVWLSGVKCTGHENNILDCKNEGLGEPSQDCTSEKAVWVQCDGDTYENAYGRGMYKLTNGSSYMEGFAMVLHDGEWGTICSDNFKINAAKVFCKSIGLVYDTISGSITDRSNTASMDETVKIWLDDVECTGDENLIHECKHKGWGQGNCDHNEDVFLTCSTRESTTPSRGLVRMIDGNSRLNGILQVYYQNGSAAVGEWGTVCSRGFTEVDANVICRSLEYTGGTVITDGHYGTGKDTEKILLKDIGCIGTETWLQECPNLNWGATSDCYHDMDVAISCTVDKYNDGKLYQLVGGSSGHEKTSGRLEVQIAGDWVSVCKEGFDYKAVQALCRELGKGGGFSFTVPTYGKGHRLTPWGAHFNCTGGEYEKISQCSKTDWVPAACSLDDVVQLKCLPSDLSGVEYRLANTTDELWYEGRLEVKYDDTWGTVCSDGFSANEANVACKSIDYNFIGGELIATKGKGGTGPVWLDDVTCSGGEQTKLHDCSNINWGNSNCGHNKDVYLKCELAM